MKNFKNVPESTRQNGQSTKKSQKHDANLQKNTTLYFQIGLIVCLLAAFGLLEMNFKTNTPQIADVLLPDDDTEIAIENFKVYQKPQAETKPQAKQQKLIIDEIEQVDNDYVLEEFKDVITSDQNTTSEEPIDPSDIVLEELIDDTPIPVSFIQNVPIFPGCEKEVDNLGRKKCMEKKITKLVQRKFDIDLASDLGLNGKQVIQAQFTIDKTGHIKNIKTRAPHNKLGAEAERVINLIPEMTPGKQNNKNVGVIYTLPIVLQVH
ncbi:energy transducer TonB [Tamlana sp. 62-3]|uniref:Energy transducer TonB n=1 Tax=Neotamlana sargassicola TaxID=2883125 RepID=A0A9X1L370_9FLAO|nr:energy transducer TonB [Tamlana sargassicola]MCB4806797.1 energy transducer TonB [Tamlana sargassicola]